MEKLVPDTSVLVEYIVLRSLTGLRLLDCLIGHQAAN